jgi:hypothetical protein
LHLSRAFSEQTETQANEIGAVVSKEHLSIDEEGRHAEDAALRRLRNISLELVFDR